MIRKGRSSRVFLGLALLLWLGTVPVLQGLHRFAATSEDLAGLARPDLEESVASATFGAFRLIIFDFLMLRLTGQMEEGNFYEQITLSETITRLMPRLETGWLYHGWHLSCNVPEELEDPESRWRYVRRGIQMYRRGEEKNPLSWSLPFWEGAVYLHVCARSETFRSRLLEDEELNPRHLSAERLAFDAAWKALVRPDHSGKVDTLVDQALRARSMKEDPSDLRPEVQRFLDHLRDHGEDRADLIRRWERFLDLLRDHGEDRPEFDRRWKQILEP